MAKYWKYKAINHRLQMIDGIAQASTFLELCVKKRQDQIQILEATQIREDQLLAERRLSRMHAKLDAHQSSSIDYSNTSPQPKDANYFVVFIRWMLSLIR